MSRLLTVVVGAGLLSTGSLVGVARAQTRGSAVYLEDSPRARELVDQARSLQAQDRVVDAVGRLQTVLERYPDKLMPVDADADAAGGAASGGGGAAAGAGASGGGVYEDAGLRVRRLIRGDDQLLGAYRRTFGAKAQRLEAQALTLHDPASPATAKALAGVLQRYPLTDAGLTAGLDLSAWYLERGQAGAALSVLNHLSDHPGLAEQSDQTDRYHELSATAGAYLGRGEVVETHRAALAEAGRESLARSVASLAEAVSPMASGGEPDNTTQEGELPGQLPGAGALPGAGGAPPLDRALWSLTLTKPGEDGPSMDGGYGGSNRDAYTTMPVLAGSRLYLNEGDRVRAVDRLSARPVWAYDWEPDGADEAVSPLVARMSRRVPDSRGVLAEDPSDRGAVYAVLGQAVMMPGRQSRGGPGTALVALDAKTGQARWSVMPGDLDVALADARFEGTPVGRFGRVIVLMQRNQAAGFQDTLVAAVDRGDGSLAWSRHLTSTAAANRYAAGPGGAMALAGDRLFVADGASAVANLDPRTGVVQWIRTGSGQANPRRSRRDARTPLGPMLCAAGLIVQRAPEQSPRLLDPATGQLRRELDDPAWAQAQTIARLGGDVVVFGLNGVSRLDGATLEPRWSSNDIGEVTHGAVAGGYLLAGGDQMLVALDPETGQTLARQGVDGLETTGLVATGGAVYVAGRDRVRGYFDWPAVREQLTRDAKQQRQNPQAGLNLAHLAMNAGDGAAVRRGLDAALAAVPARGPGRDAGQAAVFDELRTLTDPAEDVEPALQQALFDRMARVTRTAGQEVIYHLRLGRFLTQQGEADQAVEHYQAVLLDDSLSAELFEGTSLTRRAGLEAKARLEALVRTQGRGIYQQYEALARHRLAELSNQPGTPPDQLVRLAERYPLATAAPEALAEAGRRLMQRGEDIAAIAQLRRAYAGAEAPGVLGEVAGRIATAYTRSGRAGSGALWLERVRREHPGLTLLEEGKPTAIGSWIDRLRAMGPGEGAMPTVTLPLVDRPTAVAGAPLGWAPGADPVSRRLMLRRLGSGEVGLFEAGRSTPRWRAAMSGDESAQGQAGNDEAELLGVDPTQVVMWWPKRGLVRVLDSDSGEPAWAEGVASGGGAVLVSDLLKGLGDGEGPDGGGGEARANRARQRFLQDIGPQAVRLQNGRLVVMRPEAPRAFLAGLSQSVLVVADASGAVAGVDRYTGEVLWKMRCPVQQLRHLVVSEDAVALAGISGIGTDAASGVLLVVDPITGQPRFPAVESGSVAQWVGLGGAGLVVVASIDEVTAYQLDGGGLAWRSRQPGWALEEAGWANGESVMVVDQGGTVRVLDAGTGQPRGAVPLSGGWDVRTGWARMVDGRLYAASAQGACGLSPDGALAWRDALEVGQARRLSAMAVGGRYVALAYGVVGGGRGEETARVFFLDRETGRAVDSYAPAGVKGIEELRVMDGIMVVGDGDRAWVYPGADSENAGPG